MNIKCPICHENNLIVEKRPDGDAKCLECSWGGKYSLCFDKTPIKLEGEYICSEQDNPKSFKLIQTLMKEISLREKQVLDAEAAIIDLVLNKNLKKAKEYWEKYPRKDTP